MTTNKKFSKILTAILIICLIALCCLCMTAARCGPDFMYDLVMVEFKDEEHGAYFIKAEREYGGYGYFTNAAGERVEAYYHMLYGGAISVEPVNAYESFYNEYFTLDGELDEEYTTLTCTVGRVEDGVNITFDELIFEISEIDSSALRPYDLFSAYWQDGDNVFALSNNNQEYSRAAVLRCYMLDDEGFIIYRTYDFMWLDGGFEIIEGGEVVASGVYGLNFNNFEITLTFEKDDIFGQNKPFEGYPSLTLQERSRHF